MISPLTIGLVAGSVALVWVTTGAWWWAIPVGVAVWGVRVLVAHRIARAVRGLPRRVDPFALREPWRFFVRDALQAQQRFANATTPVAPGPLRDRLAGIRSRVDRGVEECWEVAQRGQHLTDSRRAVDLPRVRRVLDSPDLSPEDPRRASAETQLASHDRLRELEDHTRHRLEILDARLDEAVVRATELTARAANVDQLDEIADAVDGVVGDLESLRLGLDAADGATG